MDIFTIITHMKVWVNAVMMQVARIEEHMVILSKSNSEKLENWDINEKRIADDHFLRIAISKAIQWLDEFAEEGNINKSKDVKQSLNEISSKYGDSFKLLRNISEHEIAYRKGNGHKQALLKDDKTGLLGYDTGVDENGIYLIGGKISLLEIKNIFHEIKNILESGYYEIVPDIEDILNGDLSKYL